MRGRLQESTRPLWAGISKGYARTIRDTCHLTKCVSTLGPPRRAAADRLNVQG